MTTLARRSLCISRRFLCASRSDALTSVQSPKRTDWIPSLSLSLPARHLWDDACLPLEKCALQTGRRFVSFDRSITWHNLPREKLLESGRSQPSTPLSKSSTSATRNTRADTSPFSALSDLLSFRITDNGITDVVLSENSFHALAAALRAEFCGGST